MKAIIKQRIEQIKCGIIPYGYKKNKWVLYPPDWDYVKLNVLLFENKNINKSGKYTINDILSVSGEKGVVNQLEHMGRSYAGKSLFHYHIVETGDIVYTKSPIKQNPYGIIKLNKCTPGIVSPLYAVYHCTDFITAEYINYYFETDKYLNNYLFSLVKKGAKNNMLINNKDVVKNEIALPSTEERVKIVEILRQCDKIIELKKKRIEEEKKLKKWLLSNLLNPDSGVRLSKYSGKWKRYAIKDVAYVISGGTPDTSNNLYWNGNILWCTPTDISNSGKYISDTKQKITMDGLNNSSACLLPAGTILMCSRASIGPKAIAKTPITTNQGFKSFICKEFLNNEFFYYYIEVILKDFLKLSAGNTFKEISKTDVENYSVLLPTIEEQVAIASVLSTSDTIIENLNFQVNRWQKKKKALMQLLLTGIVRV